MTDLKRRQFMTKYLVGGPIGVSWFLASGCSTATFLGGRKPSAESGTGSGGDPIQSPILSNDGLLNRGNNVRIRPDVNSAEGATQLETYKQAIAIMKQSNTWADPGKTVPNGLNWARQAEIHLNHCPHGSWNFFSWHREYLLRFENTIRALTGKPEFNLPYWDWTNHPDLPLPFRDQGASFAPNHLFVNEPSHINDISTGIHNATSSDIVTNLMRTTDFESFMGSPSASGEPEGGPHNGVHATMGGTMGTFKSPLDPIFWLHHCNVDRLWAEWQQKNPAWMDPTHIDDKFAGWLTLAVDDFYDTSGRPIKTGRTAQDVLDTYKMGYAYPTTANRQVPVSHPRSPDVPNTPPGNSPPTERQNGDLPVRKRTRHKKRFQNDNIKIAMGFLQGSKSRAELDLLEFKRGTRIVQEINAYLASPSLHDNQVFRLTVSGFPALTDAVMKIFFYLPVAGNRNLHREIPLSTYSFFADANRDLAFFDDLFKDGNQPKHAGNHHVHHEPGKISPFNFDFKKLLRTLAGKGITVYPNEIRIRIHFTSASTGDELDVTGEDFSAVRLGLVILNEEAL